MTEVETSPLVAQRDASAPSEDGTYRGGGFLDPLFDSVTPRPNTSPNRWHWHAMMMRGDGSTSFDFECPPNGTLSTSVWGTMIYTDDSSICTAAVHAGLITVERGGTVRVYIHPGRNGYVGSGDHGVLSKSYRWYPGSFAFTETVPEDVFPPPEDVHQDGSVHIPEVSRR